MTALRPLLKLLVAILILLPVAVTAVYLAAYFGYYAGQAMREANLTESLDLPNILKPPADPSDCASFTPECEPEEEIGRKWGVDVKKLGYNQAKCCHQLGKLRTAMPEVFGALDELNVTSFMSHGSALGVARHDGGQIPWDNDGDIGFLYWDKDANGNPFIKSLSDRDSVADIVVATLNRRSSGDVYWTYHPDATGPNGISRCVKIQLVKMVHKGTKNTGKELHVDLWGVKRYKPPKLVDGLVWESVSAGCPKRKLTTNNLNMVNQIMRLEQWSYTMVPPVRCRFYDAEVWCPRDIVRYVQDFYGNDSLSRAEDHKSFYGW